MIRKSFLVMLLVIVFPMLGVGQAPPTPATSAGSPPASTGLATPADWNQRLADLVRSPSAVPGGVASPEDYRIGPDDLLSITVFDAPDLTRSLRVSAGGEISLPLLGVVKSAGLTPHQLERVLEELLRRTYMKDPHVGVQVTEMQSHSVSVMGAVRKPGNFQMRGTKTLLEVLSMAEGLAPDAGETVVVMRGQEVGDSGRVGKSDKTGDGGESPPKGGQTEGMNGVSSSTTVSAPPGAIEVGLKELLESGDPRYNVRINPGDIVKVKQAGLVYVVGEFNKPGGFPLRVNERLTLMQALALGQGLTRTAAKGDCMIIRTSEDGQQKKIPVNLAKVLKGQTPDVPLQARDIVFVPNSTGRSVAQGGVDALVRAISFRPLIFR